MAEVSRHSALALADGEGQMKHLTFARSSVFLLALAAAACAPIDTADSDTDGDPNKREDAGDPKPDAEPAVNFGPQGQPFDEDIVLDDARTALVDVAKLPHGDNPCRAPMQVVVTRAIDGDTLWVAAESETFSGKVRMLTVDAPEIAHQNSNAQCFGEDAWEFTKQLTGKRVWLSFDQTCEDHFGRLLAYVTFGPGERDSWQRQMLRRGFAHLLVVGDNRTMAGQYASDEAIAVEDDLGLWSACD
jgi:micrococcal nuclease